MVIASAMIPIMTGLKITTLGDIFLLDFSLDFKLFSFPATVVAIVCLINAFNMMDGVDGLTASLAALVTLAIMIAGWGIIREDILFLLITFSVTLIVFLIFNLSNSLRFKIFLGDAGSTFLGFFVAINLIYAAENYPQFSLIMGAWAVAVPLFDFFAVIIQRLWDAKSPFKGDRTHLHHLLLAHGLNSQKTAMVILALACGLLFLGFVIETVLPEFSLPLLIILFFVYLFVKRSQLTS